MSAAIEPAHVPADPEKILRGIRISFKSIDDAIRENDIRHAAFGLTARLLGLRLGGLSATAITRAALKP